MLARLLLLAANVRFAVQEDFLLVQRRHRNRVTPWALFAFVVVPEFEADQFQRGDVALGRMTVDAAVVFILVEQGSRPAVLDILQIDHGFGIRLIAITAFFPGPGPVTLLLFLGLGRGSRTADGRHWPGGRLLRRRVSALKRQKGKHQDRQRPYIRQQGRFPAIIPLHRFDHGYSINLRYRAPSDRDFKGWRSGSHFDM